MSKVRLNWWNQENHTEEELRFVCPPLVWICLQTLGYQLMLLITSVSAWLTRNRTGPSRQFRQKCHQRWRLLWFFGWNRRGYCFFFLLHEHLSSLLLAWLPSVCCELLVWSSRLGEDDPHHQSWFPSVLFQHENVSLEGMRRKRNKNIEALLLCWTFSFHASWMSYELFLAFQSAKLTLAWGMLHQLAFPPGLTSIKTSAYFASEQAKLRHHHRTHPSLGHPHAYSAVNWEWYRACRLAKWQIAPVCVSSSTPSTILRLCSTWLQPGFGTLLWMASRPSPETENFRQACWLRSEEASCVLDIVTNEVFCY